MAGLRYFGAAIAFGFTAVWILASLRAGLVCLLSAVIGYSAVLAAERMRGKLASRAGTSRATTSTPVARPAQAPKVDDLPLWADALNNDLGHVYDPATMSPLSREAEYGWSLDDTAVSSEMLQ